MSAGEAFPFDDYFQRAIVRLAMLDEAFCAKAVQYVDPSYFTTRARGWIWTNFVRYWQSYSVRCTELPLRDALRYAEPENVSGYASEIDSICSIPGVVEEEYIREKLADFCKRSVFAQSHKRQQDLYNAGKPIEAYDEAQRSLDVINKISFEDEQRSFFFETFEPRNKKRIIDNLHGFQNVFTTGINELDDLCDGGGQPGEVWLVQGYAKGGKTTWLIDKGFRACRVHREPVLHIQLEGKLAQTEARYDGRFSGEIYAEVRRGNITPAIYKDVLEEYTRLRGLLVIRALTDWDATILDIETELRLLSAQRFKPKMLIVDYVDLMRSRNKRVDSETQHQLEATRDLKRLSLNWNVMTHTVSQTQRPRPDADEYEHIIKTGQIADAYAKIRVIDFAGSLNATRKEREQGVSRFYAEMHRDNMVGKLYLLRHDLARMRFNIEAKPIEYKEGELPPRKKRKKDESGSGTPPSAP